MWVLGCLVGVVLGLAVLAGGWLAIIYVTVPASMLGAGAGLVTGIGVALAGYLLGFRHAETRAEVSRPPWKRRPDAPYPSWDPAWPNYLAGQVWHDVWNSTALPLAAVGTVLSAELRYARNHPRLVAWCFALVPPTVVFPLAMIAGAALTWFIVAVVVIAFACLGCAATAGAVGVLRIAGTWFRRRHHADATCPHCVWVSAVPAYPCPDRRCGLVHFDLRPSVLGVWWRRCHCGAPMPTTVRRATTALKPVCPSCIGMLFDGAGVATDLRVGLSGGAEAGTSELRDRIVAGLHGSAGGWRTVAGPDGPPDDGPTTNGDIVVPMTVRRTSRAKTTYLHLFDPPGTTFESDGTGMRMPHLKTTTAHIFVVDPLNIPEVRQLAHMPPASTGRVSVDRSYRNLVGAIRKYGTDPTRCALAVVVTKADLLAGTAAEVPSSSDAVRTWLAELNLVDLIRPAGRDFGSVRYFRSGELHGIDPTESLAWLLRATHAVRIR
jgi:hypothetical protein